ncbi:MAG: T9SS type A sorting domain-containing protein [Bacteroidota bacterium]
MRFVSLCLAFLLGPIAVAQDSPQPPEPSRFFPLAIGNAWEYGADFQTAPFRREIVRDSVINGRRYFVMARRAPKGYTYGSFDAEYLLRFDTTRGQVLLLDSEGSERVFPETPCSLDQAFGDGECEFDDAGFPITFRYEMREYGSATIAGGTVSDALLSFDSFAFGVQLASDIGVVIAAGDEGATQRVYYARIDGVESGTPALEDLMQPQPPEPWRFFPLAVGNAWEYGGALQTAPFRREVVRDSVVNGTRYLVMIQRAPEGFPFGSSPVDYVLRYDTTAAQVMVLESDGTETPFIETPCSLDVPFGVGECTFDSEELRFFYEVVEGGTGPGGVEQAASIGYDSLAGGLTLMSDIGLVSFAGDASVGQSISYARIDGVEYGTATLEDLTSVSAEDAATPRRFVLAAYPNPFTDDVTLQIELPEAAGLTLDVFDVLGRHIQTQRATRVAGDHTLVLDARAWASGTYVVRLSTEDGAVQTVRMTKR